MAVVMLLGVLCLPVLAAVRPVIDADIWWHLRAGQWMVEHGQVTSTDPFSTHGVDKPWIAYSWLFEVGVYQLYQWFGLAGVVVYRVLLAVGVVAGFQQLALRCEKRFFVAMLLSLVAAVAVYPLMNERPWLFTILFTTLTLEVVLDLRDGKKRWTFWCLPLAYVVWANVHIQFVYGFLILGIGVVAPFFDRFFRWSKELNPSWKPILGLSIACALATLVNPYHVLLYEVVIEYATQSVPFNVVQELMAFTFREPWAWLTLGLTLLTTFALSRRQPSSFELLLFALAALLCFRARRDLWMMVLASLVILPGLVPPWKPLQIELKSSRLFHLTAFSLALLFALLLGFGRRLTEENLQAEAAHFFPAKAAKFLEESDLRGPLFNHFNMGGYLIWEVPRLRVSIDGRTNLHGEKRIEESLETWAGVKGWDEDAELRAARIIFAEAKVPLASLLRLDPHFVKVYEDEQAVIFVRRSD
jgi:hypothetical protein